MMERNLLSHLKLAVLLSLLASSVLLRARLVPQEDPNKEQNGGIPMASVEFAAAMLCIGAGAVEYVQNYKDLRDQRAFLTSPKSVSFLAVGCIRAE